MSCGVGPSMSGKKARYVPFQHEDATIDQNNNGDGKEETVKTENLTLEDIRNAKIAFGIRDFNQINATMQVLTTVEPNNTIEVQFGELGTQMPESNDAKAFLASHQVAISKLAVEYCDVLLNDGTKRSEMFPGINFNTNPNNAFNEDSKKQFAMQLVNQFWGTGLDNKPADGMLEETISQLIDEIKTGETNNAAGTLDVSKGACTAVLASAPAMFL